MDLEPRMEEVMLSPYQGALELYGRRKKIEVDVKLGDIKLPVTAAFVRGKELAEILDGEKYAGTIGGLFFITKETPEEYRHFAAFHELAEHAAPRGFDVTGLARHYQAIAVELAYAKCTLTPEDFARYLEWRKSVERSNFFQLKDDGLIDRIAERIKEIFESMPKYLKYRNKQLIEIIEE